MEKSTAKIIVGVVGAILAGLAGKTPNSNYAQRRELNQKSMSVLKEGINEKRNK